MAVKDRLPELLQVARAAGVYAETTEPAPPPPPPPPPHDPDLQDMFQEVERLRAWQRSLEAGAALVRRLHADPTFHTNKQLQDQLDIAVTQANATALKLCGALRQFEARARGDRNRRDHSNDARARMARLQYATARRGYERALQALHHALQALRDQRRQLLRDQITLTNLTITDEECESLLDSKNLSLFVDNLKAETAEARRALLDAEARHEELARLEAALGDVRDLFTQLAGLVTAQQDQIDSVEYFALQASEHVEQGQRQLLRGTVTRTRARKKKLGLVICVITGIAVVLLVLIVT